MPVESLKKLPRAVKRVFVPNKIDLGDWPQVEPLFVKLIDAAPGIKNARALEAWIMHGAELAAALDEESSKRYIAMTCHTEDKAVEKAYLHFVEHIDPKAAFNAGTLRTVFYQLKCGEGTLFRIRSGCIF